MTRKIKALGLALVAVTAMGVAAATSVQAFEMHVTTSSSATILGQQAQQFVLATDAGQVKCTTVTFEGTVGAQGGQQITNQHSTLTPTLSGCSAFGLVAQIKMNGCKYTITNNGAGGESAVLTAWVDITGCTAGKVVEATMAGGCVFTAPEQHHVSHITFTNTSGSTPHNMLANVTLAGIKYEFHGNCSGVPATVLTTNGTTTGQATIVTRVDTETESVTLHGHQYQRLSQAGALVGILAT